MLGESAFDIIQKEIFNSNVGKSTTNHHFVIPSSCAVLIEIFRLHTE